MADIAERMEADANYVSQSPGDRSTDTPTDIAPDQYIGRYGWRRSLRNQARMINAAAA